jgi:ATP-dependent DNA helicase RecG
MAATQGSQGTNAAQALADRARRVLAHEQRTGHADTAVKPGGLLAFANQWAEAVRAARARGEIGAGTPEQTLLRLVADYPDQDPMRRAATVRAALALLDSLPGGRAPTPGPFAPSGGPRPAAAGEGSAAAAGRAPAGASAPRDRAAGLQSRDGAGDVNQEPWPLATPPPNLEDLRRRNAPLPSQGGAGGEVRPAAPPRPEDEHLLRAPVTAVPGVGPALEQRLNKLGLHTVRDLLFYFPREHHDFSKLKKIGQVAFGETATILGLIWEVENVRTGKRNLVRTIARISDETGVIRAVWFQQPYLLKQLPRGAYVVLTGTKQRMGNRVEFTVKTHELPEQGDLVNTGRLVPVYPLTEGLTPRALRRVSKWAVDHCAGFVPEHLPAAIRTRARLLALPEAIAQFHFPDGPQALEAARKRLAFDELFLIQLGMLTQRANWREGPPAPVLAAPPGLIFADTSAEAVEDEPPALPSPPRAGSPTGGGVGGEVAPPLPAPAAAGEGPGVGASPLGGGLWPLTATCFEASLPFRFTRAQRRVIGEVLADLRRGTAMCRLLQGDVGSGKTVVAAAALLVAAAGGYQSALLAPTEILAEQHYRSVSALLAPFGLRVALFTGGQRAKERAAALEELANGQVSVAIGTHALLQETVRFRRLGLAVVDEQHRFGVEQRDILRQKGEHPHMLVMTATPIPRTLALTLYGDLDVSTINEMPAGRLPIVTRWRHGTGRREAYHLVAEEVAAGRQAYVICPLVEESEALEARAATKEYERLNTSVFPELRLGLVHGQVRPAEKDRVMRAFRDGEIDILVATAVVEVGVDVPNASIMLIEDADRFGLSQLHQFRGRVGRGEAQSFCYLLSQEASALAAERLSVMERTTDGFALAEADLRLRGPGDFFGTRQSGMPELRVANLADTPLVSESRAQAEWLWQRDPLLKELEHAQLRERVALFWREFVAH